MDPEETSQDEILDTSPTVTFSHGALLPSKRRGLGYKRSDIVKRRFEDIDSSRFLDAESLPTRVDLRDDLFDIRNQGSQGSCVAQTAACMREYQEQKDPKAQLQQHLSPQWIYNHRNNESEGMYLRDCMKILKSTGVCTEGSYPYGDEITFLNGNERHLRDTYKEADNMKIRDYAVITSIEGLKRALHTKGPCMISFKVYHHDKHFWRKKNDDDKSTGGHAVAVVGYDDERKHFIIRNSWGKKWGDKGYTYYTYEEFNQGLHKELWSVTDGQSNHPAPRPKEKKKLFSCCSK